MWILVPAMGGAPVRKAERFGDFATCEGVAMTEQQTCGKGLAPSPAIADAYANYVRIKRDLAALFARRLPRDQELLESILSSGSPT
jgi:hypothetical protein